jgi:MFS family permease
MAYLTKKQRTPGRDTQLIDGIAAGSVRRSEVAIPVMLTTGVLATLSFNLFAIPILAPAVLAELGIDLVWVGRYMAIVFAFSILASLGAGDVVRRLGAVRVGQFCLAGCACFGVMAASGSPVLLLFGAAILGFSFGLETPAASHLLTRMVTPSDRPLLFSIKQMGIQLGAAASGLIIPALLTAWSWRGTAVGGAIVVMALVACLQRGHIAYDTDAEPATRVRLASLGNSVRLVASSRALLQLAAVAFCFSALQQAVNTFLVLHLVNSMHLSLSLAGAALAVAQIAGAASRLGCGVLADRLLSARMLLAYLGVLMTLSVIGVAMLDAGVPISVAYVICAMFGISATGWNGVFLAEVAKLAPAGRASQATGGMLAAAYSGLVFGPLMFATLAGLGWSFAMIFECVAALGAVGAVVLSDRSPSAPLYNRNLPV